jgi:hypothetical protein
MSGDGSRPAADPFNFYTYITGDVDKLNFWKAFQRGDIVHDATKDRLKDDGLVNYIKDIVNTRYPENTIVRRNEVDAIIDNKKINDITSQDMLNRMFVTLPNKKNDVILTNGENYTLKSDIQYKYVDITNNQPIIHTIFNKTNCVYKIHFTDKECIQPFMTKFFVQFNRIVVYDTGFSQEYIPKLGDNTLRSKTYCSNKIDAAASSNHNIWNAGNNKEFMLPLLYNNEQQIYLKLRTLENTENTKNAKGTGTYEFSILIKPSNDESSKATINIHGDVFSIKNVANAIGLLDTGEEGEEIFKIQYGTIYLIYEKLKEEKLGLDANTIRNCLLSLKTIGDMSRILDVQIVNKVNENPYGSAILITRDKLLESHAIKLNIPVMRYYKANNKESRYLNIFLPQEGEPSPEDLQRQYNEWYKEITNNILKITSLLEKITTIMNDDYYNIPGGGRRVKSLRILRYFDTRLLFNIHRYLSLIIIFLIKYTNNNIKNYDILRDIYWLVKRLEPEEEDKIANMTTKDIIELIIGVGSTEYEHYKDKIYGYVNDKDIIQGNDKTFNNSKTLFKNYIGENNDNCWHKKYIELREILDVILDEKRKEYYKVERDIVDRIDGLFFENEFAEAAQAQAEAAAQAAEAEAEAAEVATQVAALAQALAEAAAEAAAEAEAEGEAEGEVAGEGEGEGEGEGMDGVVDEAVEPKAVMPEGEDLVLGEGEGECVCEDEGEVEGECVCVKNPESRQKRFVLLINLKNRTIQAINKIKGKFKGDGNKIDRINSYTEDIIKEQSLASNLDQKGGNITKIRRKKTKQKTIEGNVKDINIVDFVMEVDEGTIEKCELDVLLGDIYYLHQAYLSVLNYDLEEEGYEMMYNNLRQIMDRDDILPFLEIKKEIKKSYEIMYNNLRQIMDRDTSETPLNIEGIVGTKRKADGYETDQTYVFETSDDEEAGGGGGWGGQDDRKTYGSPEYIGVFPTSTTGSPKDSVRDPSETPYNVADLKMRGTGKKRRRTRKKPKRKVDINTRKKQRRKSSKK